ncbi:hypothetical protein [Fodinibius saliphilus]|uniref:hypothetical protein n=1 Tax=Fodinibius saliphilus TaxID=1920650 RepID=UPI0011087BF1|nr:hypothetical protein [Fodinibius saliphilus]
MKLVKTLVLLFFSLFVTGCYTQLQYGQTVKKVTDRSQQSTRTSDVEQNTHIENQSAEEQYEEGKEYIPVYYKDYEYAEKYLDCLCSPYTKYYAFDSYPGYLPWFDYYSFNRRHSFWMSPHLAWHMRHYHRAPFYGSRFGFRLTLSWGSFYHPSIFYSPYFYDFYWHRYHSYAYYNRYFYQGASRSYYYGNRGNNTGINRRYRTRDMNGNWVRERKVRSRSRSDIRSRGNSSRSRTLDRSSSNSTVTRSRNGVRTRVRDRSSNTRSRGNNDGSSSRVVRKRTDDNKESVRTNKDGRLPRVRVQSLDNGRTFRSSKRAQEIQRQLKAVKVQRSNNRNSRTQTTFFNRLKNFFEQGVSNRKALRDNNWPRRIRNKSRSSHSVFDRNTSSNRSSVGRRGSSTTTTKSRSRSGSRSRSRGSSGGDSDNGRSRNN